MKISKTLQTLFLAASVAALAACGGGSTTSPIPVVTSNTSIAINPSTGPAFLQALNGQTVSFASGVAELGTTGPTTISFSGSTFTVTETLTGKTVTGPMTFGSCIFTATNSAIVAFAVGKTITVNPCSLEIPTSGVAANGQGSSLVIGFKFPSAVGTFKIAVTVGPSGDVFLGNFLIGKATVSAPTGATGGN